MSAFFHGLRVASSYAAWASPIGLDETPVHGPDESPLRSVLACPSLCPFVFVFPESRWYLTAAATYVLLATHALLAINALETST